MRASSTAGVVFVATMFVVGCAQSPSPTMASSGVTAPTSAQVAPGASYDGSGPWHFNVVFSSISGEELGRGEGDITFTQDLDGNLHATVLDGPADPRPTVVTLTRKGLGQKITYKMSSLEPHTDCDEDVSGPAQIDIATDTLTARLTGTQEGCMRVVWSITATKTGV